MAHLKIISILDLPDEVLEHIMTFLSFADLFKLSIEGTRLKECVKRVSKNKPFRKFEMLKNYLVIPCNKIEVRFILLKLLKLALNSHLNIYRHRPISRKRCFDGL